MPSRSAFRRKIAGEGIRIYITDACCAFPLKTTTMLVRPWKRLAPRLCESAEVRHACLHRHLGGERRHERADDEGEEKPYGGCVMGASCLHGRVRALYAPQARE
jgi:hypothetical protein